MFFVTKALATTVETGANSYWILSSGAADREDESSLYLTAVYELKMADIGPGSPQAKEIETNYTALARGTCRDTVEKIRRWKEDGKKGGERKVCGWILRSMVLINLLSTLRLMVPPSLLSNPLLFKSRRVT